ncbi:MAG: alcohol dehydrogenase catalytic domain-containing protein [Spirochaetales bacterium]|nr:alcohol dehydrogenase catalytic domain-containing protein [Spirochaetales bacterium]
MQSDSFRPCQVTFQPLKAGWDIFYDEEPVLSLGPGFVLVKNEACGICSTDLSRRFLPYPLPQVIGHELISSHNGELHAVEINASHLARHVPADCPYCREGLATHCPERLTLGIDRLPGGFAPYSLVPEGALVPVPPALDLTVASVIEPLAAALHAVSTSLQSDHRKVAVIGPRKLGLLLIAALSMVRQSRSHDFSIHAIVRHERPAALSLALGADHYTSTADAASYDLVFDTTGSPAGFLEALRISRSIVHLKSTHGQTVEGIQGFTEFVVREHRLSVAEKKTEEGPVIESLQELAGLLEKGTRPRSTIYLKPGLDRSTAGRAIERGIILESSRCGPFAPALDLLSRFPQIVQVIHEHFITHRYPLEKMAEAFAVARSNQAIKVLVEC